MSKNKLKAAAIAASVTAGVSAAGCAMAAIIADKTYKITVRQTDKQKQHNSNPHIEFGKEQYAELTPQIHKLVSEVESSAYEQVEIHSSHDGIALRGRLYTFKEGAPLCIFFHGYRGSAMRDGCGGFIIARSSGYNILMVDQRANGLSEGNVIAFGVLERLDCLDWCNYAVKRFGSELKIFLSGVSLGAATVLMASDTGLPKNVKCIVADCGYSSPKEIICKVAKEGGYPTSICYPLLKMSCKRRAGFDLDSASAIESVKHTDIPIMIIHGDDDRYVPCEMGRKIYEAIASEKELLIVHGAPHAAAYIVDEKAYTDAVNRFVGKWLNQQ